MLKNDVIKTILDFPLVPVFYNSDISYTKKIVEACYNGGIRAFEFTNRGKDAISVFEQLASFIKNEYKDMVLGIGTVVDSQTAQKYIDLGADFIVQPGLTHEVGACCVSNNIAWIPGVLTPTEIYAALNAGADAVKIFPGSVVGSSYVKALRGPMPDVKIMVTGGVEPTDASIKEWFGAGANAVGLGSQLFKNMDDLDAFQQNLKNLFSLIKP